MIPRPVMRAAVRHAFRPVLAPAVPVGVQRRCAEVLTSIRSLPRRVSRSEVTLGGCPTEVLTPGLVSGSRAVLYLHGGAFVLGSPATHRGLTSHLAHAAECPVYVIDYRLAPEHPWPAALDDASAAFAELAGEFDEVVVAGDSAGGWLTVALAERLRDAGGAVPTALGLVSPLIDLNHGHRSIDRDDMLTRAWVDFGGEKFAAPDTLLDDVHGLPRTVIQVGDGEMLRPDSERVAAALDAAGVPVELTIVPGMWHVWHLHAGLFEESTRSVRAFGEALR